MKVGAVSYLNTRPLIYGFEIGAMEKEMELVIDYPAKISDMLIEGSIDIGLVPVVAMTKLDAHHIISDYCIGCNGEVASVCLFSDVPVENIETVLLDYQSRSSVELLLILLREHWKIFPKLEPASEDYINKISGTTAGLIIGDRALKQRKANKYVYDLGAAWKELTGLPFVFAAWIANKKIAPGFIQEFNKANSFGLKNIGQVVTNNPFDFYDLNTYYTKNIDYILDNPKEKALAIFLSKVRGEAYSLS